MNRRHPAELLHAWILAGIPLGHVKGIHVTLHFSFVLAALFWLLLALGAGQPDLMEKSDGGGSSASEVESVLPSMPHPAVSAALFIAVLLGSVLVHELGHCVGSHLVKNRCEEILLWPLGGLTEVPGSERSPQDELIVTVAGPLASLAVALGATLAAWAMPAGIAVTTPGWGLHLFLTQTRFINWMLVLFNTLAPIFPLDGAKIIRSLAATKFDPVRTTFNLCLMGFVTAGVLVSIFVFVSLDPQSNAGGYNIFYLLAAMIGVQGCILEMQRLPEEGVYVHSAFGSVKGKPESRPESSVDRLHAELEKAVEREDFIRAAQLRDEIRELESKSHRV